MSQHYLPEIDPLFEFPENSPLAHFYENIIKQNLAEVIPQELNQNDLNASLPRIWSRSSKQFPGHIAFFSLFKFNKAASKVFFSTLCQKLIPGRKLTPVMMQAVNFRIPVFKEELFTFCQLIIPITNGTEYEQIHENFPSIQSEVRLGMHSSCYLKRSRSKKCAKEHFHSIFVTRNEEEIMRNIVSLGSQIKYLDDLPQLMIIFDEQTSQHIFFTVIIVRILKGLCLQEKFKEMKTSFEYMHERSRIIGYMRKKYPKEAAVFRVKLPKKPFLRQNNAINLNQARHYLVDELVQILGDVRDFNGGMIAKQYQFLSALSYELRDHEYNELILEDFFYSLTPDVMRTGLSVRVLGRLFLLLLESINKFGYTKGRSLRVLREIKGVYLVMKTIDPLIKENLEYSLKQLAIPPTKLTLGFITWDSFSYFCLHYQTEDEEKQHQLIQTMQNFYENTL